ncbi:hypothetical protein GQ457_13G010250 [Hibiscus cannabinus]
MGNPSNGQVNGIVGLGTSGRPPDSAEVVGKPPLTVTPDPPPDQGLQPAIERGQREKLVTFLGSDSMQTVVDVDFEDASGHGGNQGPGGLTPSFKDKLIGINNSENGGSAIKELDVEVKEEDVRFGGGSELPEIWFSDRVHEAIDAKLAKSMIVRLLGRPIGYRALWNRIHALWSPVGEISLIDLDNEYYLVRFAIEDDFHKVLSGGPWVIYGSYLTVQPWSRHFNSEEDHPSHIMVWVRLPKLPYRYYTKSLFKYIAATIGDIVRVDYNTEEGKRGRSARLAIIVDLKKPLISGIIIDGKRQDIEYDGLPSICFKCGKYGHMKESCGVPVVAVNTHDNSAAQRNPQELYGPWMQVVNRKRRNVSIANALGVLSRGSKPTNIEGSRFEDRDFAAGECGAQGYRFNVVGSSTGRTVVSVKPAVGGSDSVGASTVELPTVAARGKVVAVDSILPGGRHSAIRVVNDDGRATKSTKEQTLPASIRGSQARSGTKVRLGVQGGTISTHKTRKGDTGVAHTTVADHLAPLVRELDKAAATENLRVPNPFDTSAMDTRDVDWCSNLAFEQLDIVAVMEPRISGRTADNFIKRSSFEFSYRVEAHGFSGGIWVLWRNTVKLECGTARFVESATAIDPGSDKPWVVGGDLNIICNSSERAGGSLRRSGVCPRFNEFLFYSALVDMGFVGPKFTWRRGALFQRLDRCLCNMAWCNSFPESAIHHLLRLGSDHRPIMLESMYNMVNEGKRKAQLLARLSGIDRALESSLRPSLVRLKDKLKRELDEVLAYEESFWHQRSRVTWISEGDRNTSFYHMMTRTRREHNTVCKLRVENDAWCADSEVLKSHDVAFFKALFTSEGVQADVGFSDSNFR